MKRSKISPKDFFTERIVVEIKFTHIRRHGFVTGPHLLKPDSVVATQRFTDRKARQTSAVALVGVPLIAQLIELDFSDSGKPASKTVAILIGAQLFNVRDAIVVGINEWAGWTCWTWRTIRLIVEDAVFGFCLLLTAYCLLF